MMNIAKMPLTGVTLSLENCENSPFMTMDKKKQIKTIIANNFISVENFVIQQVFLVCIIITL